MKKITGVTSLFQLEPAFITMFQLATLYLTFVISTVDIFVPYIVVQRAGRDGWISVLIALLFMMPVAGSGIALTLRFPRRSPIEYSQMILGRWPGRLVGLLYIIVFLVIGADIARELEEIMSIAFLQHTPKTIFGIVVVCLSAYIIRSGFEVINRVNGILLPLGAFFLLFVSLSVLPRADFTRYLPVLENGIKPPISGSFILLANMALGNLMISVLPLITKPRKVIGAAMTVVPLMGGALLLGTISIPVLGLESNLRLFMPALELSRLIEIPGLPRPDILIMAGWYAGIFVKLSVAHYILAILTAQWAGLRSYKPLIVPFGVIIVTLSNLMFSTTVELVQFIGSSFTYFLLTLEFAVPCIILIVSWLRSVEEKETAS